MPNRVTGSAPLGRLGRADKTLLIRNGRWISGLVDDFFSGFSLVTFEENRVIRDAHANVPAGK